MAKIDLKVSLDGDTIEVHILTKKDLHPTSRNKKDLSVYDFKRTSIDREEIETASHIFYVKGDEIKILKQRYIK